ncbi:hypothetical protein JCM8097_008146 [Rhodosporidiobolus ruineniae]
MSDSTSPYFLAAIVVPPAAVLVLIAWSLFFYFRVLRRVQPRTVDRSSVSYPTAPQLPQLGTVHRPSSSSPFPLATSPATGSFIPSRAVPHPPFPPFDAPYAPPPSRPSLSLLPVPASARSLPSPRFAIATTVSRTGSRVLTRNTSSNNSHGTHTTSGRSGNSGGEKEERRRSKPEKTKRVKRQYGIGGADDDDFEEDERQDGHGDEAFDYEDQIRGDTVVVEVVGSPSGANLRRRNSTWGAQDLESIVHGYDRRPPTSPAAKSSASAPNSVQRPGPRPLPPGAAYGGRQLGSSEALASSDENGVFGAPVSNESAAPLVGRTARTAEEEEDEATEVLDHEAAMWTDGRRVVVQDLRDLRGRPARGESLPPREVDLESRRFSNASSFYVTNPDDEYTLTATSTSHTQFFNTTVVPLPPPSPSPSSGQPSPNELVSGWSNSSRDQHSPDRRHSRGSSQQHQHAPSFPSTARPSPFSSAPGTPPLLRNNPRASQLSMLTTTSTTAALEDLEVYAASMSSASHALPSPGPVSPTSLRPHPLPASSLFPSAEPAAAHSHLLARRPSRRQDSAPWFASPSSPNAAAPPEPPIQELDIDVERELVLEKARRPISWLARQASNGTLPDGVELFGAIKVANPDEHSLRTSTSSYLSQ